MVSAYATRIAAEMVRLYGADGRYDGSSHLTGPGGAAANNLSAAAAQPWSTVSTRMTIRGP